MRARFDEHAAEIDMVKAKKLLIAGEKELFLNMHPQRIRCECRPKSEFFLIFHTKND